MNKVLRLLSMPRESSVSCQLLIISLSLSFLPGYASLSAMTTDTVWKKELAACNIIWDSPSQDAFGSMPLPGARGAGANVWVQDGAVWVYLAHNSAYDEEGRLLKLGCLRLSPAGIDWRQTKTFRQSQDLATGTINIASVAADGTTLSIRLRFAGETLLVSTQSSNELEWEVAYGTWRDAARPAMMDLWGEPVTIGADSVAQSGDALYFIHRNGDTRHETDLARSQNVPPEVVLNLLPHRNFGGALVARGGLTFAASEPVTWQTWQGKAWPAKTIKAKEHLLAIALGAAKNAKPRQWEETARALLLPAARIKAEQIETDRWTEFWSRSFIFISPGGEPSDSAFQVGRNYQLFRQMLACNRGGELPLKFNGGIFTSDTYPGRVPPRLNSPDIAVSPEEGTTPDFRRWGQMFMSQNQRWLGWPALAAGDADLLAPSVAFYRDRLPIARQRAENLTAAGACYPEPLGLDGTVCVAPDKQGLCGAPHLIYHFSMGPEFAWMALQSRDMLGVNLTVDIPWMVDIVRFFDSFYRAQTKTRTGKELGADGKLVLYPSNSLELLGGATNPIEVVAGLRRVTEGLLTLPQLDAANRTFLAQVQKTLPDLPRMVRAGKQVLAPAVTWEKEYNPWELPELYAAWPYRLAGVTQPQTLTLARDTWETMIPRGDNQRQLRSKLDLSWQATLANTAALGLAGEAAIRAIAKLSDYASACRYPAFFGPGHDWMPDHNWGGSGMVGLQEMLVAAEPGPTGKIYLLPAWPKNWDVHFRLHTSGKTVVEGVVKSGKLISLSVNPPERIKDVIPASGWKLP